MRRSHHALKGVNVIEDKVTGEYRLPHHVSLKDGTYNNRQVIEKKVDASNDDDEE
jgi:large subunit ribosomal protein L32